MVRVKPLSANVKFLFYPLQRRDFFCLCAYRQCFRHIFDSMYL